MTLLRWSLAGLALAGCGATPTAPDPITRVEIVEGDFQVGSPGYVLADQVAVRVIDAAGAPVVGAAINWAVEDRDAMVQPASSVTGTDGVARTAWRLGRDDGVQHLKATFANLSAARFTADARSGDVEQAGGSVHHQCGRFSDDVVRCWQSPGGGPAESIALDTDIRFATLAYAAGRWCGGTRDGNIACFDDGDLTPGGNFRPDAAPVQVVASGVPLFLKLAGTGDRELGRTWCGIAIDSKVHCWGRNESGEVGDGTVGGVRATPVEVAGPLRALSVALTPGASCAVDLDSRTWCWGSVADGVVDAPSDTPVPVPVPTTLVMVQIAADGTGSVCGFDAQLLAYCWGSGRNGGRGRAGVGTSPVPVRIEGTEFFTSIGATTSGFLAVTVDRDLVVWGGLDGTAFTDGIAPVLDGFVFSAVLPGGGEGSICLQAYPSGTRCVDRVGLARQLETPQSAQLIHGVPRP
jgi:hypothetical protein